MPFVIPKLKEIEDRVISDLRSSLEEKDAAQLSQIPEGIFQRSLLRVIAKVLAGASYLKFQFLAFLSRQLFIETAEKEYLEQKARDYFLTRKSATKAVLNATVTGNRDTIIPQDARFQGTAEYELDTGYTVGASGELTIQLTAIDAGIVGNVSVGTILTLVNPIAGLDPQATVTEIVTEAADSETDDAFRVRLRERISQVARGGALEDWASWAKEVAGITRAWALRTYMGAGTVGVMVVADEADPITPTSSKIQEVYEYLTASDKPAAAKPFVFAPTLRTVDYTIHIEPDTPEIRTAVQADLKTFWTDNGGPGKTVQPSQWSSVISTVSGEDSHAITEPTAAITTSNMEVAILGEITWN